jgi:hypothetical protein
MDLNSTENADPFAKLGLSDGAMQAVHRMTQQFRDEAEELRRFLQLPDPGVTLLLESRLASPTRHFRYLHQMSQGHAEHFHRMSRVRAAYLCEAYLSSVQSLNPYGIFGAARSLLEVHASTAHLASLLAEARMGDPSEWAARGQRFFDVIVQGRYGTTDPKKQAHLKRNTSMRAELAQPLRIKSARHFLAKSLPWVEEHYASLCDVVHPNLASQRQAGVGAGIGRVATNAAGGEVRVTSDMPIVHYEFGRPENGIAAVEFSAAFAAENAAGILAELEAMPKSPFTPQEIERYRADPIQLVPQPARAKAAPARNSPCPCGSGKWYKKCHGAT